LLRQLQRSHPFWPKGGKRYRLWARMDDFAAATATTSMLEIDCGQAQYRVLQSSKFANLQMRGSPQTDVTPSNWEYPPPGSFADEVTKMVCKG
ncbi:MAG TPA: surface-adhesin E family protein, partial [Caulobacteraceae bacterium]|nr:surface-adhesin E family protein [Caulobacteraceae bacterium]